MALLACELDREKRIQTNHTKFAGTESAAINAARKIKLKMKRTEIVAVDKIFSTEAESEQAEALVKENTD